MSKLDELIRELCPKGVPFKSLEDCCNILDRKRKPITKAAREAGSYPYYGANGIQDYVADYIFDGTFILVGEDGSVITPTGRPVVNWAEGKIWVNNHAHIIEERQGVLLRYLYHFIQTVDVSPYIHGNIPKFTGGDFKAVQVPVPPLPVQEEIVRILDSFTALTAELTAELTARKEQYEFYKEKILLMEGEVPFCTLADVCDIYDSLHQTPQYADEGLPMIRVQDVRNDAIDLTQCLKISKSLYEPYIKKYKPVENDVVITRVGSYGNVGIIKGSEACLGQNTSILHPSKCDAEFLFYYLTSGDVKAFIEANVNGASHKSLSLAKIKEIPFPNIPIEVQRRKAFYIKAFHSLCNDIVSGIPAEITARQKQYEYYRDKLLTFKELS